MAEYNGHRSRAAWNVSLWINNDESLYRWARELRQKHSARRAARIMLESLPARTPDGYRYTVTSIAEAIADINN